MTARLTRARFKLLIVTAKAIGGIVRGNLATGEIALETLGGAHFYVAPTDGLPRERSIDEILDARMQSGVRRYMPAKWRGRGIAARWTQIVKFSLAMLRAHLERQFAPGMGWHNIADWHIDHIRPLVSFQITGPYGRSFREAWALANLQPLWGADNARKGAKWSRAQ